MVEDKLSMAIIDGEVEEGDHIEITLGADGVIFEIILYKYTHLIYCIKKQ